MEDDPRVDPRGGSVAGTDGHHVRLSEGGGRRAGDGVGGEEEAGRRGADFTQLRRDGVNIFRILEE